MRAHVFDMDGTLLYGTSGPVLLADALGHPESIADLEARFSAGTATTIDFARALHEMWGVVAPEAVARAFSGAPIVESVREVLEDIHARGERACLITMSPAYFAEQFLDYGLDAVFASRFPSDAATPLDETAILDPRDKPRLAAGFCAEWGFDMGETVAYGDSMSDVHLFDAVGYRISVNGDHHLAARSDAAVVGTDLMVAYRAARRLVEDRFRAARLEVGSK